MSLSLRHFAPPDPDAAVRLTLVCFPHAGAGATAFALWRRHLPDWLDLYAHVSPGREERVGEAPLRSVEALIADVMPEISQLPEQLVVIGHSFGACLAYELAHLLASQGRPPAHLVVLAAVPPGHTTPPHIDDDHDIEMLWTRLGADTARLARPEFREMVFPALRADLAAHVAYRPPRRDPLPVPLTIMYGDEDPSMTAADASAWRALCAEACRVAAIPGGHFFPRESGSATVHTLVHVLSE